MTIRFQKDYLNVYYNWTCTIRTKDKKIQSKCLRCQIKLIARTLQLLDRTQTHTQQLKRKINVCESFNVDDAKRNPSDVPMEQHTYLLLYIYDARCKRLLITRLQ